MRQVFTSPRLENVEAVAALLRDAGIEVKITEPRSYRGNRRSSFSYRDSDEAAPQSAVWIVRAEDQPRGRQLLREAGLLDSSRAGESSYLPLSVLDEGKPVSKAERTMQIKLGLLVAIVVVIGLMVYSALRQSDAPTPVTAAAPAAKPAAPPILPQPVSELTAYRASVPTALASMLIETELSAKSPAAACIAIDSADPQPAFLQALASGSSKLFPASSCPADAYAIRVQDYMTDGSGLGTVLLQSGNGIPKQLDVAREGITWQVRQAR